MDPYDLVDWSHTDHKYASDLDLDDAASFAIEKYLSQKDRFDSNVALYSFLNITRKRKYKDEKIKMQRLLSLSTIAVEPDDSADAERNENIEFVRHLIEHLSAISKSILKSFCEDKTPKELPKNKASVSIVSIKERKELWSNSSGSRLENWSSKTGGG